MLSRPAGPTRGHFVLPRSLVLSVTSALPATAGLAPGRPSRARARVSPAPEPGAARPRSRLLSVTRPSAAGLPPSPCLVPRAPPPEPRSTRRPLLSSCRAAWPAPGLVILTETTPQTGRSSTSGTGTGTGLLRRSRPTGLRVGLAPPRGAARRCGLPCSSRDVVMTGLRWVRRPGYQPVARLAPVTHGRTRLSRRGTRPGRRLVARLPAVAHGHAGLPWRRGRRGRTVRWPVARLAAVTHRCAGLGWRGSRPSQVRRPGYQPVAWLAAVAGRCAGLGWRGGSHGRPSRRLVAWLPAMTHGRAGLAWRRGRTGRWAVAWFAAVADWGARLG